MCFCFFTRQCVNAHYLFRDEGFSPKRTGVATPCLLQVSSLLGFYQSRHRKEYWQQNGEACHPDVPKKLECWTHYTSFTPLPPRHRSLSPQPPSEKMPPPTDLHNERWKSYWELCVLKHLSGKPHATKFPRYLKWPAQAKQPTPGRGRRQSLIQAFSPRPANRTQSSSCIIGGNSLKGINRWEHLLMTISAISKLLLQAVLVLVQLLDGPMLFMMIL